MTLLTAPFWATPLAPSVDWLDLVGRFLLMGMILGGGIIFIAVNLKHKD